MFCGYGLHPNSTGYDGLYTARVPVCGLFDPNIFWGHLYGTTHGDPFPTARPVGPTQGFPRWFTFRTSHKYHMTYHTAYTYTWGVFGEVVLCDGHNLKSVRPGPAKRRLLARAKSERFNDPPERATQEGQRDWAP